MREGSSLVGYNRVELPWAPVGVALWRYNVSTKAYEHQIADDGWTNPRWIKAGLLTLESGQLVLWRENDWLGYVLEPSPAP